MVKDEDDEDDDEDDEDEQDDDDDDDDDHHHQYDHNQLLPTYDSYQASGTKSRHNQWPNVD